MSLLSSLEARYGALMTEIGTMRAALKIKEGEAGGVYKEILKLKTEQVKEDMVKAKQVKEEEESSDSDEDEEDGDSNDDKEVALEGDVQAAMPSHMGTAAREHGQTMAEGDTEKADDDKEEAMEGDVHAAMPSHMGTAAHEHEPAQKKRRGRPPLVVGCTACERNYGAHATTCIHSRYYKRAEKARLAAERSLVVS